ncbi:MAG TPA: hypothetical protein VMB71_08290, partial [Acetobacteraceae bacterium]|nr:hypothetical protein [Acetobacteraceae bacterium]
MTSTDSTGTSFSHEHSGLARKACALSIAIAMAFGASTAANAAQVYTHHVRDAVSTNAAQQVG